MGDMGGPRGSKGIGRERGEFVFVWVIACWTSVCVWGKSMGLRGGRESKRLPPL